MVIYIRSHYRKLYDRHPDLIDGIYVTVLLCIFAIVATA